MCLPPETGKKNYAFKAHYRESENLGRFAENYGIGMGNTRMITITFRDNVTDKKEAASRWNVLLTSLKAIIPVFRYIAVWERQQRGAWHMHLLVSAPTVSNKKLREYFNNYSSVSSLGIGFVKIFWTTGNDFKGIKNYLTKYLLKEAREKGVRYVGYSMNWIRKVKGQFAFLGGQARKWRLCCDLLNKFFPQTFEYFYQHARFEDLIITVQKIQKQSPREFILDNPMIHFFSTPGQCWYGCTKDEIQYSMMRRGFSVELKKMAYFIMNLGTLRPTWVQCWIDKTFFSTGGVI